MRRSVIQAPQVEYTCTTDEDCYPPDVQNSTIPRDIISCDNSSGLCQCNNCFVRENDTCTLLDCHHYDSEGMQCVDQRRSQKTAFILSVVLSSTGAANFYIGQYLLGK